MSLFSGVKVLMSNHGPTIMTVVGVVGITGAGVLACKATIKAKDIKIDMDMNVEAIRESGYSDENQFKADIRREYISAGRQLLQCYGPALFVGAVSIGSILYGHNMLNRRNLVLAGAYKLATTDFDAYRSRVAERLGEDMERSICYNMQTIEVNDMDDPKKSYTVEYVPEDMAGNETTIRSVFFDESSIYWEEDPEKNKEFLLALQKRAQEKYDRDGYLFLSWIYKNLDVQETYASNICGWVKGYTSDTIDFGIYDVYSAASRRFVNGLEPVILLNFNDGGYIADKI